MAESFLQKLVSNNGKALVVTTDKSTKKTLESIDETLQKIYKQEVAQDKKDNQDKKRASQAARRKAGDPSAPKGSRVEAKEKKESKSLIEKILGGFKGLFSGGIGGFLTKLGIGAAITAGIAALFTNKKLREGLTNALFGKKGLFGENNANKLSKALFGKEGFFGSKNIDQIYFGMKKWFVEDAPWKKSMREGIHDFFVKDADWKKDIRNGTSELVKYVSDGFKGMVDGIGNWIADKTGFSWLGNKLTDANNAARKAMGMREITEEDKKRQERLDKALTFSMGNSNNATAVENYNEVKAIVSKSRDVEQTSLELSKDEDLLKTFEEDDNSQVATATRKRVKDQKEKITKLEKEIERLENLNKFSVNFLTENFGYQSGGPVRVPGSGTGDKVPMMLPPGSFVMNRNAAGFQTGGMVPTMLEPGEDVYGPGQWNGMHQMMNSLIPRFQNGGEVNPNKSGDQKTHELMNHLLKKQNNEKSSHSNHSHKNEPHKKEAQKKESHKIELLKNHSHKKEAQGFQSGGVVEYITGDRSHSNYASDHGGGNYHEHIGFDTPAQADAAAKYLESQGYYIGSRNDGKHATNSLHYSDRAFDVPFYPNHTRKGYSDDQPGEEKFSDDVRKALSGGGYDVGGAKSSGAHGDPYEQKDQSGNSMMSSIGGILSGIGGQMGDLLKGLMGAFSEVFGEDMQFLFGGISSLFSSGGGKGAGQNVGNVSASSDPLTGDTQSKAKAMYEYIKGKGYSDAQARGIVVNIQRESNFDATAASGDDGGAGGLFQWKGSRQTSQVQQLVGDGNWKGQIDYALQEDAGPRYKSETASMSPHQAADWWMNEWERPADPAAGSAKHASMLQGLGFQKGGIVNMKGSASSNQRFEQAQEKFADRIAEGIQPVVVPMPSGGSTQAPTVVQNSGSQTDPPNLPAGPSSLQAAEYLYRLNMANAF